jgi:hypothetical protein
MSGCPMITSPSFEGSPEVECGKPILILPADKERNNMPSEGVCVDCARALLREDLLMPAEIVALENVDAMLYRCPGHLAVPCGVAWTRGELFVPGGKTMLCTPCCWLPPAAYAPPEMIASLQAQAARGAALQAWVERNGVEVPDDLRVLT